MKTLKIKIKPMAVVVPLALIVFAVIHMRAGLPLSLIPPLVHEYNMSEFNNGTGHITPNEKELTIAVDPNNPNRLMAVANRTTHEWYASSDGGRTFTRGEIPIGLNLTIDGVPNDEIVYSDPWVAYGSDGWVYHSAIAHRKHDNTTGASVVVQASGDQGQTWTDPADGIVAAGQTTPKLLFHDKESMAVDRVHGDNVYLVWNPRQGPQGKQIVFSRDLGGHANGFSFSPTIIVSSLTLPCRNHGPNITVDSNGTIWVAWTSFCTGGQGENGDQGTVWVAKSTNQGQSFETPTPVASLYQVGGLDQPVPGITGEFRSSSDPSIASDPLTGRLFIAYATNASSDHEHDPDIQIVTSSDGVSWGPPVRVNQDTGTSTQVHPAVAVHDGIVVVNFYSTADGADLLDDHLAYAPVSASPSFTEVRLTSASTPQPTGFLGDYTAVAFGSDGVAHAAWTDQRSGGDTDAYSARIDFSPPRAITVSASPAKPFGQDASFTATVTGAHNEGEQFIPVHFAVNTSGSASPANGFGTSNASGQVSFSYSNAHASVDELLVWADLNENGLRDSGETRSIDVIWLKHPTKTTYTGPTLIADELRLKTAGRLTDNGLPIAGRTIVFTLGNGPGSQMCSDSTNLNGVARCDIAVQQLLGPGIISAAFAGDSDYEPSSALANTIVFAYTSGGNFVIGDLDLSEPGPVIFWSSKWSMLNHISGGPSPGSFKGFANTPAGATSCGGIWTASGGNSTSPPARVPAYTAMLVTSSVTGTGGTIIGNKPSMVIVRTDNGYQSAPGHTATGHIVGTLCP